MCEKCVEVAERVYPGITDEEMHQLLWEATAYPFAQPEHIEKQLLDHKANTDGTVAAAVDRADKQMTEAAKRIHP